MYDDRARRTPELCAVNGCDSARWKNEDDESEEINYLGHFEVVIPLML
jgi:hypothetical protein